MLRLEISKPAKVDIQSAYDWWRLNRSAEQAERWYRGIHQAIESLKDIAVQYPRAPETRLHPTGLRQLQFGLGRHPTHRVVFAIDKDIVRVVRVRHVAQRSLGPSDLEELRGGT